MGAGASAAPRFCHGCGERAVSGGVCLSCGARAREEPQDGPELEELSLPSLDAGLTAAIASTLATTLSPPRPACPALVERLDRTVLSEDRQQAGEAPYCAICTCVADVGDEVTQMPGCGHW